MNYNNIINSLASSHTKVTIFTLFLLGFLLVGNSYISKNLKAETMAIVAVGDLYELEPNSEGRGGYAKLAYLINELKQENDYVLFLHAGDAFSPSVVASIMQGKQAIDLLNHMKLDYFTPGNHEFDFGTDVFTQRIEEANFSILGANFRDKNNNKIKNIKDNNIITIGKFKIGIYGLITPRSSVLSSTSDLKFLPLLRTAKQQHAALKDSGANFIIALSHTNIEEDLKLVKAGVADLLVSGDDHFEIAWNGFGSYWLESGEDAETISVLKLEFKVDDEDKITTDSSMVIYDSKDLEEDPSTKELIKEISAKIDIGLQKTLAKTSVDLDTTRASVRGKESNFGNLIADALKDELQSDVAFMNGGGIRGNKIYPAGSDITLKDVYTELPFGNVGVSTSILGSTLLECLENSVSEHENQAGRFAQVSGIVYAFDLSRPKGKRITSVLVNNQALNKNKKYIVATNNYLLSGGDGYSCFTKGTVVVDASSGKLVASILADYITKKGDNIDTVTEGRITIK